jgi:hypothetical protein
MELSLEHRMMIVNGTIDPLPRDFFRYDRRDLSAPFCALRQCRDPLALSVKALCLDSPPAHLLGYSVLSTLRKARRVEARLSRFHTIAKSVVGDRPLIGR